MTRDAKGRFVKARSRVDEILGELDSTGWTVLIDPTATVLKRAASRAGAKALLNIGLEDKKLTDLVDDDAVAFASARAAELVGMRVNEAGELVENEEAEWSIVEGTRTLLRSTVTEAITQGWAPGKLQQAIEEHAAFDEARARSIARTELSYAHEAGNTMGWERSGVVSASEWLPADDPCDDCQENADEGPVPLGEAFPSGDTQPPAHPHCECTREAVVDEEDDAEKLEKGNDDEERDEHGRWTSGGSNDTYAATRQSSGGIVASSSYTDKDGYKVTLSAYKNNGPEFQGSRQGETRITTPKGGSRYSGYWMNAPEPGHPDFKEWNKWQRSGGKIPKWYSRPLTERLAYEAKLQGTRYGSLKDQFKDGEKKVANSELEKGSEDQPRDEHGRWSAEGGFGKRDTITTYQKDVEPKEPFTAEEKEAMEDFFGDGETYFDVNASLRRGADISKAGSSAAILSGLSKLPAYQGTVHRGEARASAPSAKNFGEGKEITTKQFLSGSLDKSTADVFAENSGVALNSANFTEHRISYEIEAKTATPVWGVSQDASEKEVVFAPRTRFKITSFEKTGKGEVKAKDPRDRIKYVTYSVKMKEI